MERCRPRVPATVISTKYGVSFSAKQCRNFKLDSSQTLNWLLNEAGFRRFRLMSYWNEHEKSPGQYDFLELDEQVSIIEAYDGVITLCLGTRQPRWPENHWPDWAWQAPKPDRDRALLDFIRLVVERYKDRSCIISYQLENEALLADFGERSDIDRCRLRDEFRLVRQLDQDRPIIMTTSTSWGIPIRRPIPDIIGFSFYHTLYQNGRYKHSLLYPWFHRLRRLAITMLLRKPVFIHELQMEPWGSAAIWEMTTAEQDISMNTTAIARNLRLARAIDVKPIDLWGGEWWYWRYLTGDDSIWRAVKAGLDNID
jgi:hypothetical protein